MKDKIDYKFINYMLYGAAAIVVFIFLQYLQIIEKIATTIGSLTPFFIAFFIAWLMQPVGIYLQKKFDMSEKVSMALAIIANIVILLLILGVLIPLVFVQLFALVGDANDILQSFYVNFQELLTALGFSDSVISGMYDRIFVSAKQYLLPDGQDSFTFGYFWRLLSDNFTFISSAVSAATHAVSQTFVVIGQVFVAYIMAFYFIHDVNGFVEKTIKLFSGSKDGKYIKIAGEISETIFGYIRGLLLDCSFLFVIEAIGLSIIGVTSPILLALLAAMFNIIPYVGPLFGAIPILLIALSISFKTFVLAAIVVFGAQFVEAYFILPRIMSKVTNLHPVSVLIGLIIFFQFFGFVGMIIATPCMASINVLLKHSKYDIRL